MAQHLPGFIVKLAIDDICIAEESSTVVLVASRDSVRLSSGTLVESIRADASLKIGFWNMCLRALRKLVILPDPYVCRLSM